MYAEYVLSPHCLFYLWYFIFRMYVSMYVCIDVWLYIVCMLGLTLHAFYVCMYTCMYIYSYVHMCTQTHTYTASFLPMVSELGQCISCFPDNRRWFSATGSHLGNGMRKFVKAKKDFNIPWASVSLEYVCIKVKTWHTYNIYSNIKYIHTFIHTYIRTYTHTYIHTHWKPIAKMSLQVRFVVHMLLHIRFWQMFVTVIK